MTLGSNAEPAGTPDFILAISPTRSLQCRAGMLSMRDGGGKRWQTQLGPARVIAAAVLFDGRAAAVHVAARTGRDQILVLALRDGAIERRITIDHAAVAFAARPGLAIALVTGSLLLAIDLRLGRVISNRPVDPQIVDVTVDETGHMIELWTAQRHGAVPASRIEIAALSRLASGTQPPPVAATDPTDEFSRSASHQMSPVEPVPSEPPSEVVAEPAPDVELGNDEASEVESVVSRPLAVTHVRALPLRYPRLPATHAENLVVLAALRDRARAFAALAIARRWDDGRIAFEASKLPHRTEVTGLLGVPGGLAIDEVDAAIDRLLSAMARCAQASCAVAPRWSPLMTLSGELQLSTLALDILIAIAAPQLWRDVGRLYELIEERCDVHLITALLTDIADPGAIAAELEPDAPLVKLGLVREEGGRLAVDRIVLRLLRGDAPLGDLAPVVRARPATRTLDELQLREQVIREAIAELETAPAPLRLVVRGRDGSGGRSLIAAIVEETGRTLCTIDASPLIRDPRTCAHELACALQRAHIAGFVPCIANLDRIGSDDAKLRDDVRAVLAGHAGPIAMRCAREARPPVDGAHVLVELPTSTPTERRAAWTAILQRAGLADGDANLLADRYAIGPGVIERVVATVEPGLDTTARLDRSVRRHLETLLGATATRIDRLASWSQVVLPPDIQDSVTELIARVRHRATVFDAWGFDKVMSTSRGVTALFQGGPGTGKTMVAGAIARELGVELYRVDVSKIMSKWIGETEQNLAKLFDAAEDSHAMLLFDEADSLFAKRTEVKSSVDRYANTEVNYLLQRLDTFEGLAILCTNFGTSIDSAFKRRMSFRLTFPFPDEEQRERLWKAHVPAGAPIADDIDFTAFARRFQLSGGYIRNCMLRTAFLAAEHGGQVTAELLERAIKAEFREIGKLAQSGALE